MDYDLESEFDRQIRKLLEVGYPRDLIANFMDMREATVNLAANFLESDLPFLLTVPSSLVPVSEQLKAVNCGRWDRESFGLLDCELYNVSEERGRIVISDSNVSQPRILFGVEWRRSGDLKEGEGGHYLSTAEVLAVCLQTGFPNCRFLARGSRYGHGSMVPAVYVNDNRCLVVRRQNIDYVMPGCLVPIYKHF